jgi:ethanolamine utilization cobalamin adenosyltransferase
MIDYLGWAATAVFVSSYFFDRADLLRAVQMLGAILWVIYGALIGAIPVVAANLLVFAAAAWATIRGRISSSDAARVPTREA